MVLVRLLWYEIQSHDWWFIYVLIRCRSHDLWFIYVFIRCRSFFGKDGSQMYPGLIYRTVLLKLWDQKGKKKNNKWLLSATYFLIFFVNILINCILFQTLEFNYTCETYSIFQTSLRAIYLKSVCLPPRLGR